MLVVEEPDYVYIIFPDHYHSVRYLLPRFRVRVVKKVGN